MPPPAPALGSGPCVRSLLSARARQPWGRKGLPRAGGAPSCGLTASLSPTGALGNSCSATVILFFNIYRTISVPGVTLATALGCQGDKVGLCAQAGGRVGAKMTAKGEPLWVSSPQGLHRGGDPERRAEPTALGTGVFGPAGSSRPQPAPSSLCCQSPCGSWPRSLMPEPHAGTCRRQVAQPGQAPWWGRVSQTVGS